MIIIIIITTNAFCEKSESQTFFLLLQLYKVDFRKVGRTATEYRSILAIQGLIFIANPDMLAEPLSAVDLIVADAEIIAGDPNHRTFSP
jgi:hypothetical protein